MPFIEERPKGEILMKTTRNKRLTTMVTLAMLGTISFVLMLFNFPLPFLPPFLKVDFSDIPALIAGIVFSPLAGVVVVGLKNVLYYVFNGGGVPVGEVANFFAGVAFMYPVAWFYHKRKSNKALASGLLAGTITMALSLVILNYLVILPAYAFFFGMADMADPAVKTDLVLYGILPFNLIKAILISALFVPLFLKLKPWIERQRVQLQA